MLERFHRSLARFLWRGVLCLVVLLATYVSLAQLALDMLPRHRQAVTDLLASQLNLSLRVEHLQGQVRGFTPELRLTGLQVAATDVSSSGIASLQAAEATISIDPWASLMALQLRPESLQLAGMALDVKALEAGTPSIEPQLAMLVDVLRRFGRVRIVDSTIGLRTDEERFVFDLDLNLRRYRSQRNIQIVLGTGDGAKATLSGRSMGNPSAFEQFNGQFYGTIVTRNVGELTRLFGLDSKGQADLQFWIDVNQGVVATTVDWALSGLQFALTGSNPQTLQFDSLSGLTAIELDAHQGKAFMNDVSVNVAGNELHIPRATVVYQKPALSVAVASIDAEQLASMLLAQEVLSSKASNVIATLNPKGTARQFVTQVDNIAQPLEGWSAKAQITNTTTSPYKGMPGLMGIDAIIEADDSGAVAWINTEDFKLDLPRVYEQPLAFSGVEGVLKGRWTRDVLWLEGGVLQAQAAEHSATVLFGMDIPLNAQARADVPLAMYLDVSATGADIAVRDHYIPKTISGGLDVWLDSAFPRGYAEYAAFSWRGSFGDYGGGAQSMQLEVGLRDATFVFDEAWPAVETARAHISLDTQRLSVWSEDGRFDDLAVSDLSVEGDISREAAAISADADFEGDAQALLDAIRVTPVYNLAAGVLDDLSAEEGRTAGHIEIGLDALAPARNPSVLVDAELSDVSLRSTLLGASFTDIEGHLNFDLEHGFSSEDLRLKVLDEPLHIQFGPGASGSPGADIIDARFDLSLPASKIEPWLLPLVGVSDAGWQPLLAGEMQLDGRIAIGQSSQVLLNTELLGTSIDLPAPLGKVAQQSTPLRFEVNLGDQQPWHLFWSDRASARIYRRDATITGALIDLTPTTKPATLPQGSVTDQVQLTGTLPMLDIDPWLGIWERLAPVVRPVEPAVKTVLAPAAETILGTSVAPSPAVGSLAIAELEVTDLRLGDVHIGAVQVDMTPHRGWDMVGVNTDWLDAEFAVYRDNTPSSLIVNTLDLDRLPSPLAQDQPRELLPPALKAPIDVILANVYYAGRPLGAARFHLSSDPNALVISDLGGQLAGLRFLPGSALQWSRGADAGYQTSVTVDASLKDSAQLFKDLNREPAIASRSGTIAGVLSWPGSPLDIDSTQLLGDLSVTLQEGAFLPVSSSATGIMRVLSVLNLAGLFQRANVTRLFDPGVTFKRADGQFVFEPGHILVPHFDVDARGGGFKFESNIDLLTQTIDGELIVTLPLAENIPWVAALAGGLPVAAGAYLMSKVFEDQVKSLSSGVYSVSGELSQPKVRFERVFDATPSKTRATEPGNEPAAVDGDLR